MATELWAGHAVGGSARDGTSVAAPDDGRPDDGRPDDIFVGGRHRPANETDAPGRGSGVTETTVRRVPGRAHVSWRHALAAGVTCFAVWLLLDAPTLLRSAQESPFGHPPQRRHDGAPPHRRRVGRARPFPHRRGGQPRHRAHGEHGERRAAGRRPSGPRAPRRRAPPAARGAPGQRTAPTTAVTGSIPTTTPVTAPDGLAPLGTPTPSTPLRLLVVGDSLGIDFGQPLVNDLAATDVVSAVLDGHIDTGLSRPDYFNWQTELQTDLAHYQPQAVVVFIGANDPQSFVDNGTALGYGSAAWNAAYGKRVGAFMQAAVGSGARVLWVGMPPMADPVLNAKMETLNEIDQSQAALHHGVTYFASWPVLSDPQGHFAAFLPDASGNEVQIRDPDGTHLAEPGAQRLSQAAIAFMDHEWGLVL